MFLVYEQVNSAEDQYFAKEYLVSTMKEAVYLAVNLRSQNEGIEFGIHELKPLTAEEIEKVITGA